MLRAKSAKVARTLVIRDSTYCASLKSLCAAATHDLRSISCSYATSATAYQALAGFAVSGPVTFIEHTLDLLQSSTGLPWWLVFTSWGLLSRAVLVPFAFKQVGFPADHAQRAPLA